VANSQGAGSTTFLFVSVAAQLVTAARGLDSRAEIIYTHAHAFCTVSNISGNATLEAAIDSR